MTTIRIPVDVGEAIFDHARSEFPHECCGLLVGRSEAEVFEAQRAANLNLEQPEVEYELDPRDFIRVQREAESNHCDIVGFYHSHPQHGAYFSATDHSRAWPNYLYLVVSVIDGEPRDTRAFVVQYEGHQAVEVPIEWTPRLTIEDSPDTSA